MNLKLRGAKVMFSMVLSTLSGFSRLLVISLIFCFWLSPAVVYTVEFQKRGLPHAHILLFLHPEDKYPTTTDIDKVISAEIPDQRSNPVAYEAVKQFMIHGPCGEANPKAPCMLDKKCSKHFPKKFYQETTIDEDGFPIYRRRQDGNVVEKNGLLLDNRYVVPYNEALLVKYQSHINVEWCNRSRSIKYLFKYINKGPDRGTMVLHKSVGGNDVDGIEGLTIINEVKTYLDCRYVSASEACWRIYKFGIHYRDPVAERLSFHLQDEQSVTFTDTDNLESVLKRIDIAHTKFTQWMEANKLYEDARELTYADFPTKWVWYQGERQWKPRKLGRCIGRIYYCNPASSEKFYLRMLLNIVRGPRSFEEIRTINSVVYPNFKTACYTLGLLDDDREWHDAIIEASNIATDT